MPVGGWMEPVAPEASPGGSTKEVKVAETVPWAMDTEVRATERVEIVVNVGGVGARAAELAAMG